MLGLSAICRSLENCPFKSSVLTSRCHCFRHATRQDSSGKLQNPPGVSVNRIEGSQRAVRSPGQGCVSSRAGVGTGVGKLSGRRQGRGRPSRQTLPSFPASWPLCRLVKTVAPHTRGNWERWVPDPQWGGDCVASGVGCPLRPLIRAAAFSSLQITFNPGSSLG